ncbi:DUF484 family protein [Pelagibius sp.]|uniref:DUF484 family protein n=1 Tax=Pelagibius sp. TaxID=1931238 RepID=UPI0026307AC9|nr:DUF484 family protein [Pelagibius sp.]
MPESETQGKEGRGKSRETKAGANGAAKSGADQTPDRDGKAASRTATSKAGQAVSGDQVAAYLRRHPEFLADNPDLLDSQEPPARAQGDGVIDLQQVQVQRLRDKVGNLTSLRDELLSAGRNNLSIQNRVHRSVLAILNARSFEEFVETITTDMAAILDLDVVTIGVEKTGEGSTWRPTAGVYCLEAGSIDALLGPSGTLLLRDNISGDPAIFDGAAGIVQSDALIRLNISETTPPALLALGSRQAGAFHAGQGTELLSFLSQVLEVSFRSWLNLPPRL